MPPGVKGTGLIEIDLDYAGRQVAAYWKHSKERFHALRRMIMWALANDLMEELITNLPQTAEFRDAVKSLKVGEVFGSKTATFSVFMESKAQAISKLDSHCVLIYIRPRSTMNAPPPEIQLLADRGPWTMETLPFWPAQDQAVIIQRKTSVRSVERVERLQRQQKTKVAAEFRKLGTSVQKLMANKNSKLMDNRKTAVPDLEHSMLSLEFGSGKQRAEMPWRKSMEAVFPNKFMTLSRRFKQIQRTLTDAGYSGWKSWPKVSVKITAARAASFLQFQKRIMR